MTNYDGVKIIRLVFGDIDIRANGYNGPDIGYIGDITAYQETGPSAYYTWFKYTNHVGITFRHNSLYVYRVDVEELSNG